MTTSLFELSIIKRLIEKNEWKKTYGLEGDILWTGLLLFAFLFNRKGIQFLISTNISKFQSE